MRPTAARRALPAVRFPKTDSLTESRRRACAAAALSAGLCNGLRAGHLDRPGAGPDARPGARQRPV